MQLVLGYEELGLQILLAPARIDEDNPEVAVAALLFEARLEHGENALDIICDELNRLNAKFVLQDLWQRLVFVVVEKLVRQQESGLTAALLLLLLAYTLLALLLMALLLVKS